MANITKYDSAEIRYELNVLWCLSQGTRFLLLSFPRLILLPKRGIQGNGLLQNGHRASGESIVYRHVAIRTRATTKYNNAVSSCIWYYS